MAAINDGQPIRFEAGGTITFTDSGSLNVEVNNRERGTLEVQDGGHEVLPFNNKGVMQTPLEGDELPSTIRLRVKLTKKHTNDIITLSQNRDTSTGRVKIYTVVVKWLDHKNVSTFTSHTFAGVYFASKVRVTEGDRFDTVEIMLNSTTALATYAAG